VTMETAPCPANHRSAPARSYVCPSAATTGSRITCPAPGPATPHRVSDPPPSGLVALGAVARGGEGGVGG
jgi:hypothetical protein